MFNHDFDRIIRENFDLSDRNTRKYIVALEDAGKEQILNALSSALYENIVSKVDDIDFGTIPASRGDITKVQGFDKTEECLSIIRRLVLEYKQNPAIVDVVLTSIANIKERKSIFIKAYGMNIEFPMLMYNLIVLAIERSVSLMIATCIHFAKDPSTMTPKMALDKAGYENTMDDTLYKQLITFNNLCNNGTMDKMLNSTLKPVKEDAEFMPIDVDDVDSDDSIGATTYNGDPFEPDNTVEPYNHTPDAPETEIPDLDDFDKVPVTMPAASDPDNIANYADLDDNDELGFEIEEDDAPYDTYIEPRTDEVEPENIPQVVPSDGFETKNDDIPITELLDDQEELEEGAGTLASIANKATDLFASAGKGGKIALGIGTAIAGIYAIKGLGYLFTNAIIPALRNLAYGFYYSKMKFSDYLSIQADLIEANANELEHSSSTMDENKKKKVIDKQRKVAISLRKWSDKLNIDTKETAKEVDKAEKEEKKNKKRVGKDDDGDDVLF